MNKFILIGLVLSFVTIIARGAPFTPGNVVIYRVGDGSNALASTGNAVFLDEYRADGTLAQSIFMPSTWNSAHWPLIANGIGLREGLLTRSSDARYLLATGYGCEAGNCGNNVSRTAALVVPRVIARIDSQANLEIVTWPTDYAEAGTNGDPHSVTSIDGVNLWFAGTSGGARYGVYGASTSVQLNTQTNINHLNIVRNQLYASISPGGRIAAIGTGTPKTPGQTPINLPGMLPGSPHAFFFADLSEQIPGPDTLYVADDTARALSKYSLVDGSWSANGTVGSDADDYRGLTGIMLGKTVRLYATRRAGVVGGGELVTLDDASGYQGTLTGEPVLLASASPNTTFRGVAMAPELTRGAPLFVGLESTYSGVVGDLADPGTSGFDFYIYDDENLPANFIVAAGSSNPSVARASVIPGRGPNHWRLIITPIRVGYAAITVKAQRADYSGSSIISVSVYYAASAGTSDPEASRFPTGAADGSTALAVDNDYVLIADDEDQVIRLYRRDASGPPVANISFTPTYEAGDWPLGLTQLDGGKPREVDIESSTRQGKRTYWMGSHGNASNGNARPNRWRIFAADLEGQGEASSLSFAGRYDHFRADIINWDMTNRHGLGANFFGLNASSVGIPERIDGFNIEGLSFIPKSATQAYVAFRAPIVPPSARTRALVVPILNFSDLAVSGGPPGSTVFGTPLQLTLGGRGIRSLECNDFGCLIVAGPFASGSNFALYTWSGNPDDAPVRRLADLSGLTPEGIAELPNEPLGPDSFIQLISDQGSTMYYGDGIEAKDLPHPRHKKFRLKWVRLGDIAP